MSDAEVEWIASRIAVLLSDVILTSEDARVTEIRNLLAVARREEGRGMNPLSLPLSEGR